MENEEAEKKQRLVVKPYTIILTVGPTGSGKSFFSQEVLIPQLKNDRINVQYLSSDQIRKELLGKDINRFSREMDCVSGLAFDLLHFKLNLLMQFPIAAEVIIIDTNGLGKDFRDRIIEQAKSNHYRTGVIVFHYDTIEEHLKSVPPEEQSILRLKRHLDKLQAQFYPHVNEEGHDFVFRVRKKDFSDIQIQMGGIQEIENFGGNKKNGF
jgi:archaellum biogenesis ATPase FlaH